MLECLGDEPTHFIFGKPAALFEKFTRRDVIIADKDGPERSAPGRL